MARDCLATEGGIVHADAPEGRARWLFWAN
jgi:hypothetical protein